MMLHMMRTLMILCFGSLKSRGDIVLKVEGASVPFVIDSGASINVIDSDTFWAIQASDSSLKLQPTRTRVMAYTNKTTPMRGIFFSAVTKGSRQAIAKVYVTEEKMVGCLLSRGTTTELGVLKVITDPESAESLSVSGVGQGDRLSKILQRYRGTVLNEPEGKVGKVKDYQLKLNINESVVPVVQKVRNTPFHVRKQVENKIRELIEEDIIEEVTWPTTWVSPIVIDYKKDGEVRICTDMREANKAIESSLSHPHRWKRYFSMPKEPKCLHKLI